MVLGILLLSMPLLRFVTLPSFSSMPFSSWRRLNPWSRIQCLIYYCRKCHQSRGLYPKCPNSHLIGICTGALAAAAISCCHSLSELLPVAVQVVVLSFRAGALAADFGARLQTDADVMEQNLSWAFMCPDLTVDHANPIIDAFSESRVGRCFSCTKYFLTASTENTACFSPLCEQ